MGQRHSCERTESRSDGQPSVAHLQAHLLGAAAQPAIAPHSPASWVRHVFTSVASCRTTTSSREAMKTDVGFSQPSRGPAHVCVRGGGMSQFVFALPSLLPPSLAACPVDSELQEQMTRCEDNSFTAYLATTAAPYQIPVTHVYIYVYTYNGIHYKYINVCVRVYIYTHKHINMYKDIS